MNGDTSRNPKPVARMDENDPVWRLLAQAPRPEPDAWFAARTMARCRNEGLGAHDGMTARAISRVWRWALGGGLAVCMAVLLMVQSPQTQAPAQPVDKQQNVQEAFEIVASMNTDSDASSSSSSWQDSSL